MSSRYAPATEADSPKGLERMARSERSGEAPKATPLLPQKNTQRQEHRGYVVLSRIQGAYVAPMDEGRWRFTTDILEAHVYPTAYEAEQHTSRIRGEIWGLAAALDEAGYRPQEQCV